MSHSVRVLVVDANPTARRCTERALTALGADVVGFASVGEAAEDDRAAEVDLAVVDCSRPAPEHYERLTGFLAAREGTRVLPTSVRPDLFPPEVAERPTVGPIVPKPYTPHALCLAAIQLLPDLLLEGAAIPFPAVRRSEPTDDIIDVDIVVDGLDDEDVDVDALLAGADPLAGELTSETPDADELFSALADDEGTLERFDQVELPDWDLDASALTSGSALSGSQEIAALGRSSPDPAIPEAVAQLPDILWDGAETADHGLTLSEMEDAVQYEEELEELPADVLEFVDEELVEEAVEIDDDDVLSARPAEPAPWAVHLADEVERLALIGDPLARAVALEASVERWRQQAGAAPPIVAPADEPTVSGDLSLLRPIELFRVIRDARLHGALELYSAGAAFRLTLWGDTLRYLEPRVPTGDLLLGRILLARGMLEREALDIALNQTDERPLGARLLEVGILTEEELWRALELQARGYFYEICAMGSGRFVFREVKSGTLPPFGASEPRAVNFRVSQLVLDIVRDAEEGGEASLRPTTEDQDTRMVTNPLGQAPADAPPSRPNLRLVETRDLDDGPTTVDDPATVDEIVHRLQMLGLLDESGDAIAPEDE